MKKNFVAYERKVKIKIRAGLPNFERKRRIIKAFEGVAIIRVASSSRNSLENLD